MKHTEKSLIDTAEHLCNKFIKKVETGRAYSKETYTECKNFLKILEEYRSKEE